MRITGLEAFGLGRVDAFRQDIRQVYQGLGRFYSSRYSAEKHRPNWERASLYFETAVRIDPVKPPPELLKDLGVHLTLVEQVMDERAVAGYVPDIEEIREAELLRSRAERNFRESLLQNPLEPGALFGLGWVLYKKPDYRDAIAQYTIVTTITSWAPGDRQKYLEDAYLNQAGCYSLLAGPDPNDPSYATALACLRESKVAATEFGRLIEWKMKVEQEVASRDLRKLQATRAQELTLILT